MFWLGTVPNLLRNVSQRFPHWLGGLVEPASSAGIEKRATEAYSPTMELMSAKILYDSQLGPSLIGLHIQDPSAIRRDSQAGKITANWSFNTSDPSDLIRP